uniref:ECSIT N-terminal domain-containing protein n=1 Tax=Oncorhynchus kisutch TaxID=8019 RepID=A0A8C7G4L4_ONCKI
MTALDVIRASLVARKAKTKATFNGVVDVFSKRGIWRRGHVEFIYAALKKVPEFGVERDLTVYNKLLDVFPKEVFVPRNFIQCMFNHYPRHQECGVHLLEQMENSGGWGVGGSGMLVQIFRDKIHPMRNLSLNRIHLLAAFPSLCDPTHPKPSQLG